MRSSAEDDYGFSQPLAPPAAATSGVYAEPYAPLQQGYTQGYTPQPTHPHYAPAAGWQSGGFPQPGDDPAEQLRGNMGNGLMDTPKEAPRATVGMRARNISSTLLGEGEPDEPPILEELGINFSHIYSKTKAVLWPRRIKLDQQVIDDCDFAGPLLFCLALAMLLLLKGKVQFSYIYVVFIIGLFSLWAVLNLMSLRGLDIYRTASVLGYCLLPIVLLAAISVPLDLTGAWGMVFVPLAIFWCSNAAALFFVVILHADDQRWLLVYPVMLFYTCFALITIF